MEQKAKQVPVRGQGVLGASGQLGLWRVGGGLPGALEIMAAKPRQQGAGPAERQLHGC